MHDLFKVSDVFAIVDANKLVRLFVYGLDCLLGAKYQREHFGVFVSVVGHKVGTAYLPSPEELLRVVLFTPESIV